MFSHVTKLLKTHLTTNKAQVDLELLEEAATLTLDRSTLSVDLSQSL